MRYRPTGEIFHPQQGTLEHFLTERYCLYAADAKGQVSRGEIQHAPWSLQNAAAEFHENSMTNFLECGVSAPLLTSDPQHPIAPLLHFSRRQDVVVWHPHPI
jgi:uncharacterized protein YqjF (DUF2071 family)